MNGDINMADDGGTGNPVIVALAPKLPAAISILGSYVLIRETYMALKENHSPNSNFTCRPLLRIVLAMSVADIIFSIPYVVTTWAAPAEIDNPLLWGNIGTTATCTAQGFMLQLGKQLSPTYNFLQGLFSLLMVRYAWKDSQLAHLETYLHAGIWVYALTVSIFPLFLDLYNNNILICYIGSYPIGCKDSLTYGETDCERGDNAWAYALAFGFFPYWPCIVASAISMVLLYLHVRKAENRISRYAGSTKLSALPMPSSTAKTTESLPSMDFDGEKQTSPPPDEAELTPSNSSEERATVVNPSSRPKPLGPNQHLDQMQIISRNKSRAVATQAYWYMASFLLTQSLNLVNCILFFGFNTYNELFDIFTYILVPLQGILNFLVYVRPRPHLLTPEGRWLRSLFFDQNCFDSCENTTTGVLMESSPARPHHASWWERRNAQVTADFGASTDTFETLPDTTD